MRNDNSFTFLTRRYHFSKRRFVWFCLIVLFTVGLSPQISFAASSSPQVVIAVDTTSPACVQTIVKIPDNPRLLRSTSHMPCAPGTTIGTKYVTLSQAKAMHTSYVFPADGSSSPAVRKAKAQAIEALLVAKRQRLQAGFKKTVVPNATCGWTIDGSVVTPVQGNWVSLDVQWHTLQNCGALVILIASMSGLDISTNMWWYEVRYASSVQQRCPPGFSIQNGKSYSYPINTVAPVGYDFVWWVAFEYDPCINLDSPRYDLGFGPMN